MKQNFEIVGGIYLVQVSFKLDLHNNFDFKALDYSLEKRTLTLHWQRSEGSWICSDTPGALRIEFSDVSEFRFMPRAPAIPFTEDDCVNSFGYWLDDGWAEGVITLAPGQNAEPQWLTAIDFMSGAVLAVRAARASAEIIA